MQEAMIELLAEFFRHEGLEPMCADEALHRGGLTELQRTWLMHYSAMWDTMQQLEK